MHVCTIPEKYVQTLHILSKILLQTSMATNHFQLFMVHSNQKYFQFIFGPLNTFNIESSVESVKVFSLHVQCWRTEQCEVFFVEMENNVYN